MPIQRIHVENFKSFSELDIELSRFNVVIGSNAAGKSNFISIFKFLRDIAKHGIVNAIAMQGGSEYLQNTKIGPLKDLQMNQRFLNVKAKTPRFSPYNRVSLPMSLRSGFIPVETGLRSHGTGSLWAVR
jgi:predicted ATPase